MSKINEMIKRVNELRSKRITEIEAISAAIEVAAAERADCLAKMDEATSDARTYADAVSAFDAATRRAEILEKRLREIKESPLITKDEYRQRLTDVVEEVRTKNNEAKRKIFDLVGEIEQIGNKNAADIKAVKDILRTWEHEIYRGSSNAEHIRPTDYSVSSFAARVSRDRILPLWRDELNI